jgi:hypothetical protein
MAVATHTTPKEAPSPGPSGAEPPKPAHDTHKTEKAHWETWAALSTIVLAVFTALGSMRVAANSNKAILNQSLAGNAWAYFQAKSIKEHTFELQKDLLVAQATHLPASSRSLYDERIAKCSKEVNRYKGEKADIEKDAKKYETARDDALKRKDQLANSVTMLQVAVMIASVSLLIKRTPVWVLSLLLGSAGIVYYVNGYLLAF